MIGNILLIGWGLIIALGAFIMLDREGKSFKPRMQYSATMCAGLGLVALTMCGIL